MQLNIERLLRDASEIKRDSFDLYIMQRDSRLLCDFLRVIHFYCFSSSAYAAHLSQVVLSSKLYEIRKMIRKENMKNIHSARLSRLLINI